MSFVRRLAPLVALGLIALFPTATTAAGRDASPTLAFAKSGRYTELVRGSGWPASARITFSLAQSTKIFGLELRDTRSGTFEVGVSHLDLCAGELYAARDFKGDRSTLSGPRLGCPVPPNPRTPNLTVVEGSNLTITVTHVDLPPPSREVIIKLADAVYVWEQGTGRPVYLPSAPSAYLELIGKGTTPPRACPQRECDAGFFWEWVGMRQGTTAISLNPSCYPQCQIASFAIPVRITARK